jgi:hypothetical protein
MEPAVMDMGRRTVRTARTAPWALGVFCLLLGLGSTAQADLYRYQAKDGSVLITTEPRGGLKLLEIIGDGGGGGGESGGKKKVRTSEKHKRIAKQSRERAARHKATNPNKVRGEGSFDHIIQEASRAYDIPFAFIKGVIRVESNFNPYAVSRTGAMGLMQLMPATARYLGVEDAFDPRQNIFGGAKLLRILSNQYNGDINLLLAAYNAGEGAVEKYDGIPYRATQDYVRKVYHFYKHYQRQAQDLSQN